MTSNTRFNLPLPLRQCRLSECYVDARIGAPFLLNDLPKTEGDTTEKIEQEGQE